MAAITITLDLTSQTAGPLPGNIITVSTTAQSCIAVGTNDFTVCHTGRSGTSTSTAGDYVMFIGCASGTTLLTAAGFDVSAINQVSLVSGQAPLTLRGIDVPFDPVAATDGDKHYVRKLMVKAFLHDVTLCFIKGNNPTILR